MPKRRAISRGWRRSSRRRLLGPRHAAVGLGGAVVDRVEGADQGLALCRPSLGQRLGLGDHLRLDPLRQRGVVGLIPEGEHGSPPIAPVGVGGVQQTGIADHQFAGPHRDIDLVGPPPEFDPVQVLRSAEHFAVRLGEHVVQWIVACVRPRNDAQAAISPAGVGQ